MAEILNQVHSEIGIIFSTLLGFINGRKFELTVLAYVVILFFLQVCRPALRYKVRLWDDGNTDKEDEG